MTRSVSIVLIATLCFAVTATADEPDPTKLPAVRKALDKADADVARNRKAFDEANAKAYAEAEKALKAEADRLSKASKPEEAVEVKNLLDELKAKLVAGEPSPRKKEDPKKPVRRLGGRKQPNPAMVGADPWNGHHYKVVHEPLSWKQAKKWCEDNGGHLVIIENQQEHDALVQWLTRPNIPDSLWVGATDEQTEGAWLWVDGTPVAFTKWKKGEPDNHGGNKDAHFALMNVPDGGSWDDTPAWQKAGFICEWDE